MRKRSRSVKFPKKTVAKVRRDGLQTFSADDLQDIHFPELTYVVDGLITEGLTLLAGKPKMGKSWMALDLAMSVALGREALGSRSCEKGTTLYCALEDNQRRLQRRIIQIIGDEADWSPHFHLSTQMKRVDEGGLEQLENWIIEHDPCLVIIDTLARIRSKHRGKNEYETDYAALTPLQELASKYQIAILVIHHLRKMNGDDPLDKVSGSTGLTGAADTVLVLDRMGHGITLEGRGREMDDIDITLELDDCLWRVLGNSDVVKLSSERKAIIKLLQSEKGPMGPNAIAEALNQPQDNIRQLLSSMATDGDVKKRGRGKYVLP